MWTKMFLVVALCGADAPATTVAVRPFETAADEFLAGYFAFRPHTALELGNHDYDGKLADYGQESLTREHERLKQFEERFAKWPVEELNPAARADHAVLLAGLRKAKFEFDGAESFQKNPITYLLAIQIDNYLLREYSPLPERIYAGQIVTYRVRPLLGVPVTWVTEIAAVEAP